MGNSGYAGLMLPEKNIFITNICHDSVMRNAGMALMSHPINQSIIDRAVSKILKMFAHGFQKYGPIIKNVGQQTLSHELLIYKNI